MAATEDYTTTLTEGIVKLDIIDGQLIDLCDMMRRGKFRGVKHSDLTTLREAEELIDRVLGKMRDIQRAHIYGEGKE